MGKGKEAHERVIAFIAEKHRGESEFRLQYMYPEEWEAKWRKERPLTVDYYFEEPNRRVLVEVFISDEWRTPYGKAVTLLYEAEQMGSDCEVWLVTDCKARSASVGNRNWNSDQKRNYLRDCLKEAKRITLSVLHARFADRLKFYDFDGNRLEEV